ncbi:MAG TPA: ABC transporter ATP-binding protein [Anaerolineae bacterium]|nr:ABC transporter ATP-binding protein [Anaerolineae bacterium]MCB9108078.1 ABC transporter ATP-binding protein [Anaerolineales bacterium]HRV92509.1 ABC transporter ATP-binding protein [Anaerolineae bacterium]
MATIKLRQVEKRFGEFQAVKPMDLTIDSGEFVVFLGPSGCGKTTTLRMISGLESVSTGDIFLDNRKVTWLRPSDRDIAFVFQFFALYPHMTARQNIAFPLQAEGESKDEIDRRIKEVVDLLQIGHLLNFRPGKLSGGDKQRVALARALVRRPAAFLMDEPLGALDADFRESMRAEIKRLHLDLKATTVYVTHDQIEAMAMSDRIVVMSNAEVQQVGTPAQVYYDPANLFVARFIGSPGMNLITSQYGDGVVRLPGSNRYAVAPDWRMALGEGLDSDDVIMGFRPEAAHIKPDGTLVGEVYASELYGAYTMLHVELEGNEIIHIRSDRQMRYPIGSKVRFDLDPEMVRFFNPKTEMAIN